MSWWSYNNFFITKKKGRTFLQTFKVSILKYFGASKTLHHIKKYTYLIGSWWPMHDCLRLDPCPHDAVGERCALKPSPLFLILYPALACSLSFLLCTSKPKPLPKAFFGYKYQCIRKRRSQLIDLNLFVFLTIVVVAILNRTPQRHAGLWQR